MNRMIIAMSISRPQIAEKVENIQDFLAFSQDFLEDERQISAVRVADEHHDGEDFAKLDIRASSFENCSFVGCNLRRASFVDVIFRSCDFSNSKFSGGYFERCHFISCKCMGVDMGETWVKHTVFEQSNYKYANFDDAKLTDVRFDQTDFTEASISEVKLKRFEAVSCKFIKNNFFKTALAGVDFTENEFAAPLVSIPPSELRDAVINMVQAADLMALWGIIVKE